jgi:DNA-binding MarR family transcriptional regulator
MKLNDFEMNALKNQLTLAEWAVFNYLLTRHALSHRPGDICLYLKKSRNNIDALLDQLKLMDLVIQDEQGYWKVNL